VPRRLAKVPTKVFQLKVTLRHVEPEVWRQLLVPADVDLGRFHLVVNEAMGWTNSHLHMFRLRDRKFGDTRAPDAGELHIEDERKVRLDKLVGEGQVLDYDYDFGDGWDHDVLIEKVVQYDNRLTYPLCIDGARACPPEDCGGPPGYENLLAALTDERHAEHDELLTWVGGRFDPERFDINRTNVALRALR
jgi:hypothetical protein